jgi:hypothetical protein
MPCKCQLFFARGPTGFSEVYYHPSNDPTVAIVDAGALSVRRLAMMTADVFNIFIRASLIGTPRTTVNQGSPSNPNPGTFVAPTSQLSQQDGTALRFTSFSGAIARAVRFLHCPPEDLIAGDVFTPTPTWTTASVSYRSFLSSNFVLKHKVGANFTYPTITLFSAYTLTTRHVGRPFDSPRGRRIVA